MRKRPLYGSAIVLAVTGLVHATGTGAAAEAARTGALDPLFERALGALWVDFSVVMLLLAVLLVYAARHARPLPGLVKIVAVVALLQAIVTAAVAGLGFPFVWVIAVGAGLAWAGAIPRRDLDPDSSPSG